MVVVSLGVSCNFFFVILSHMNDEVYKRLTLISRKIENEEELSREEEIFYAMHLFGYTKQEAEQVVDDRYDDVINVSNPSS